MYSIVMVAAMAAAPEAPSAGCLKSLFCCPKPAVACAPACAPVAVQSCAPECAPASRGCGFCGIGGKLRSCFGNLCHKPAPCPQPCAPVVTECNSCPTVAVAPPVVVQPVPVPTPVLVPVPTPMPKVIPVPTPAPKVIPTPTPKTVPNLGPTPDVKPAIPADPKAPKADVKPAIKVEGKTETKVDIKR